MSLLERRGRSPGLVALGDSNPSLSHLPAKSADRWPEAVGRQLGLPVLNLGRDATTIRDAYQRGSVDQALHSGAKYLTIGFAVDDCISLGVAEFAGRLDRLLYEVESTVMMPVLLTGVWLDYPTHCSTNRSNEELQPINDAIRSAAAHRGARLVDVAARMQRHTARGGWDLRIREGVTDDQQDVGRSVKSGWWDDVHLNAAGSRLVTHLVLQTLRERAVAR